MRGAATGLLALLTIAGSQPVGQSSGTGIKQQQLRFPRVRTANQEKDAALRKMVKAKGLEYPLHAILLRAFKKEGQLELWGAESEAGPYVLLKSYGIVRPQEY
jgi:hypothetical protein